MTASGRLPAPIRAIVFDFDGTLVQTPLDFAAMRRGVIELAQEFGIEGEALNERRVLELTAAVAQSLAARDERQADDFRRAATALMESIELAAAPRAQLVDGAADALDRLCDAGLGLAIITRNCRAAVRRLAAGLPIPPAAWFTRDDVERVKPDPLHLHTALGCLRTPPAETLMVGDHPLDMEVGRRAGSPSVGVLTGGSSRESLLQAGAMDVLTSVEELPDWLLLSQHGVTK